MSQSKPHLRHWGSIDAQLHSDPQRESSSTGAQRTARQNLHVGGFRGQSNNPYNSQPHTPRETGKERAHPLRVSDLHIALLTSQHNYRSVSPQSAAVTGQSNATTLPSQRTQGPELSGRSYPSEPSLNSETSLHNETLLHGAQAVIHSALRDHLQAEQSSQPDPLEGILPTLTHRVRLSDPSRSSRPSLPPRPPPSRSSARPETQPQPRQQSGQQHGEMKPPPRNDSARQSTLHDTLLTQKGIALPIDRPSTSPLPTQERTAKPIVRPSTSPNPLSTSEFTAQPVVRELPSFFKGLPSQQCRIADNDGYVTVEEEEYAQPDSRRPSDPANSLPTRQRSVIDLDRHAAAEQAHPTLSQNRPLLPEEMVQCHRALNGKSPTSLPREFPQRQITPQYSSPNTTRQQEMVERNGARNAQASGTRSRPEIPPRRNAPRPLSPSTIRQPSHIGADARLEDVGNSTRNEQVNATFPVSRRWQGKGNSDPPPYSTTERLPIHVKMPSPIHRGVPEVTPNGFTNSTTPAAAAHPRTAAVPPRTAALHAPTTAARPPPNDPKPEKKSFSDKFSGSLGKAKGKCAVMFRSIKGVRGDPQKPDDTTDRAFAETRMYLNAFSKMSAFTPYEETAKKVMDHTLSKYDTKSPGRVRSQRSIGAGSVGVRDVARPPPPTAQDVANMPTIPPEHRSP